MSETIPSITNIWTDFISGLTDAYLSEIRRHTTSELSEDNAVLVTYFLGGMLDQAVYAIYGVHRNLNYERAAKSKEGLARAAALLQYRALYCRNPDPSKVPEYRQIVDLKLNDQETVLT